MTYTTLATTIARREAMPRIIVFDFTDKLLTDFIVAWMLSYYYLVVWYDIANDYVL